MLTVGALFSPGHLTSSDFEVNVENVRKLQELEFCFTRMLTSVKHFYADSDVLADMKFFLDNLLETDTFRNCATIDEIFHQLCQAHVDTFNICYLEQLTARFQRDAVDMLIEEYKEKKEEFLNETVVTDFHHALASRLVPFLPGEKAALTIKVPHSLANKRTLKDMERLAGKAFGDYYKSLVTLHVIPGSIIIIWFFPKGLADKLKQLAEENEAVFNQEGVEEVTVAGKVVFSREIEMFEEKGGTVF